MATLSKKKKIILIGGSVVVILALLAMLLTMFLYVPSEMTDGVNDDIRWKISYFDYENYFFKNGDIVMPFRLKSPKNAEAGKTYPLIVFLHGGGSNGIDNVKSMCGFYLKNLKKYAEEDYYCLVPQAPEDRFWDVDMIEAVERLLDEFILPELKVDETRIYLSGSSMGGRGSLMAMSVNPNRYAAAMFDAAGFPSDITQEADENGRYPDLKIDYASLKNIPMLISHGLSDDVVPIEEIKTIVANLKEAGNTEVTLRVWENLGHETVDEFYGEKSNWDWLFSQKKTAVAA